MAKQGFITAKRRYMRALWPLVIVYLVAVFSGSWMLRQYDDPPVGLAITAALAAALPLAIFMAVVLRYFTETDEYTRLRQLIAFARGAAFTVSAIFIFGFLQLFDVIGDIEVFWFGPLFLMSWGLSYCFGNLLGKTV
ncbi:MAG: hypothetical protein AAF216_03375 [Pseudomonadota bacterium]